jgi:hypothetical protein
MKTKLLFSALLSFSFCLLSSQVPQGFNYQAIARDGSGTILANLALPVKIDIQTSLTGGTLIYEEQFASVTSNNFGLISLVVGTGTQTGGSAASFSAINWKAQTLFLKTIIQYPGTTWTTMGTSQIWGVPYSLVAKDVEGPIAKLGITGTTTDMEEALFEVKNQAGNTVFAVYNEGIRAYVGNGDAKGAKGGFAVGGYDATKGTTYNLFTLNTDSARFYIDSKPNLKGKRGGFSVGGYDMTKAGVPVHDYLDVSKDSVRIYVDSNPLTKGKKGGFSVGGYDMTKGGIPAQDYMHVSKDSVRVYIDSNPLTKGVRGGFAVGGYDMTKGTPLVSYMRVTTDSTRVYVSDVTKTGSLGGFAVKPVAVASANKDFFNITNAPTAAVINNEPRVMWYSQKSALIGGEVHVGSADSVGQNSTALGYRSIAKGTQSQAFGYRSIAYGSYSTAIGYRASSNNNSMAVGYQATASGSDAFALGSGALAIADKSFAFGSVGRDSLGNIAGNTKATGDYAYALGLGALASGRGAFAIGANDTASGNFSTSIGYKTRADGWYATAIGSYSRATNSYSIAFGYRSSSSAVAAFASGFKCVASGDQSVSMGYQTRSSASYSVALGYNTKAQAAFSFAANNTTSCTGQGAASFGGTTSASGQYAIAAGQLTTASGWYSFAGGDGSTSSGQTSFCVGKSNSSAGNYSLVTGIGNTAKTMNCVTIGSYCNDPGNVANINTYAGTDPLFIAGNGTLPLHPSQNALILYKNGNMTIAGTLTQSSDIRLKNVISELGNVLPQVLQITPIIYEFKDQTTQPEGTQIGFSAQEIQKYFPELVTTDANGYLALDYSKLSVVLLKAVKEQQKMIDTEKLRNDELEKQIRDINLKLAQITEKKAGE